MTTHPNCKINIGLHVTHRRDDGFHNLETIFYPVPFADELTIEKSPSFEFIQTGIPVDCPTESNLCVKAYRLLQSDFSAVSAVKMQLKKNVPMGAGLGGGSSDAAFTLKMLNSLFALGLSASELKVYAARLGADCAFFIDNTPSYATGKGEVLTPINLSLNGLQLVLLLPAESVSTAEAYRGIVPRDQWKERQSVDLREATCKDYPSWAQTVVNDFERTVFAAHPQLQMLKQTLYERGALYASMSGSGSTIYGLFPHDYDARAALLPCLPSSINLISCNY